MKNYSFFAVSPSRPLQISEKDVTYHSSDEFTLTPRGKPYEVEMVVKLSHQEFANFAKHQTREWDFIADNKEYMFNDSAGICHGALVLGERWNCGYILDPGGTDGAAYCASVKNAQQMVERLYPDMRDLREPEQAPAEKEEMSEGLQMR